MGDLIRTKKDDFIEEIDFMGSTLSLYTTGAYGSSLSSNYNTKPLIAEILVKKNKYIDKIIVSTDSKKIKNPHFIQQ